MTTVFRAATVASFLAMGCLATAQASTILQSFQAAPWNGSSGATAFAGSVTDTAFNNGASATFTFSAPKAGVNIVNPQAPDPTGATVSTFGFESTGFGVGDSGSGRFERGESFVLSGSHAFQLMQLEWREYSGDEAVNVQWVSNGVTYSEVLYVTGQFLPLVDIVPDAGTGVTFTNVSNSGAFLNGRLRINKVTIGLVSDFAEVEAEHMFGVNLAGGDFGIGTHNTHYFYPTAADFDYYNSKGMKLMRVPFKWENVQKSLNGSLDSADISRLDAVADLAAARGMKVIFSMHNYLKRSGSVVGSTSVPTSSLIDFWGKFSVQFNGHPGVYGYGLMNEPSDPSNIWVGLAQDLVDTIRENDTETYIYVSGRGNSAAANWPSVNAALDVSDPSNRIIYEAHCYWDANNDGTYGTYDAEGCYPDQGLDRLEPFVQWLRKKGARGYIGEFGVPGNDSRYLTMLDRFMAFLADNGISATYWAGGNRWTNYPLSCQPTSNYTVDSPQMNILENYPAGNGGEGTGTGLRGYHYDNADFTGLEHNSTYPSTNLSFLGGAPAGSGFAGDSWTARFIAKLKPRYSGTYTFHVTADDDCRLWVNDKLLIDDWNGSADGELSASITLRAGHKYNFRTEFREIGGYATCHVRWSGPGTSKDFIPTSQLYPEGDGLRGLYYDNNNFTGAMIQRYDPRVYFNWSGNAPFPTMGADSFSVRWDGKLLAPGTGTYTITARSDDGSRLWINGTQLINHWGGGGEVAVNYTFTSGQSYDIRFEFLEIGGGASTNLKWSGPGLPGKTTISGDHFFSSHLGVSTATDLVP